MSPFLTDGKALIPPGETIKKVWLKTKQDKTWGKSFFRIQNGFKFKFEKCLVSSTTDQFLITL